MDNLLNNNLSSFNMKAEDIAGRIVTSVMSGKYKTKGDLYNGVLADVLEYIKIRKNSPKLTNKKRAAQLRSAMCKQEEALFWKRKMQSIVPNAQMQVLYKELNNHLIEMGYKNKSNEEGEPDGTK